MSIDIHVANGLSAMLGVREGMPLGELIERLEGCADRKVRLGFGKPHSYRGYYEDLAFEPVRNTTVGAMLKAAKGALEKTFEGYKGGDFTMTKDTHCWIAEWGGTGEPIGPLLLSFMLGEVE